MFDSFSVGVPVNKEEIRLFLLKSFRMMEESPIVRQMFVKSEMEQLLRKLPNELLEQNFTEDKDFLFLSFNHGKPKVSWLGLTRD